MKDNFFGWNLENSYSNLPSRFFKNGYKTNFENVELVLYNKKLAKSLGLNENLKDDDIFYFSGNKLPENSIPIHQAYAGHQFGHFNILGDGRAMLIGEQIDENKNKFDIQLKGSGRSFFSRSGDGKATLKSMLREYLISEAMFFLNIPTTRSLCVVKTGEKIYRENISDGAILTRVAKSHLRVGTFQFASLGEKEEILKLTDYAIERHFSEIKNDENKYIKFLEKVIDRQANLIAKWICVSFIHGVMNTDNITISGETIDFGPCAFLNEYEPKTVFSSIDINGRYRFENQPVMAQWGLSKLAESLISILDENKEKAIKISNELLENFEIKFKTYFKKIMENKLGLDENSKESENLISTLLNLMEKYKADFTNTFVRLTLEISKKDGSYLNGTEDLFESDEFKNFKKSWLNSISNEKIALEKMKKTNPFVIPRNYSVEIALNEAVKGNIKNFENLLTVLQNPYNYDENLKKYQNVPKIENYRTFCGT